MIEAKRTKGCVYHTAYHIVWIPKYRKSILVKKVAKRLETLIHEIANKYGFEILAPEIMPDHIHLFVSAHPKFAPATLVKLFKGITARKLFKEFPELKKKLRKKLRGGHFWIPSYYVGTAGNVSAETIRRYIEECQEK